jgi:hypothetical protein
MGGPDHAGFLCVLQLKVGDLFSMILFVLLTLEPLIFLSLSIDVCSTFGSQEELIRKSVEFEKLKQGDKVKSSFDISVLRIFFRLL